MALGGAEATLADYVLAVLRTVYGLWAARMDVERCCVVACSRRHHRVTSTGRWKDHGGGWWLYGAQDSLYSLFGVRGVTLVPASGEAGGNLQNDAGGLPGRTGWM